MRKRGLANGKHSYTTRMLYCNVCDCRKVMSYYNVNICLIFQNILFRGAQPTLMTKAVTLLN